MNYLKLNIIFGCSLLYLLTVQCTDLTETPYTEISSASFYKNADELSEALTSVYDGYQAAFGGDNYYYTMILEVITEFNAPAYAKNNTDLYNCWNDINNATDRTIDCWDVGYVAINRANTVLGRGENVDMDQTLKEQYFGEARFLRALSYFNLVRLFGGLPIPASFTESLSGLEIPRQSVDSTYNYIISDLKWASGHLPLKSEASDVWRATKGAAQAALGEVYLTLGSMNDDASAYQLAKQYCDSVITSGEYSLEPDFKDLWYWWNTNNKNGKESVFELQYGLYSGLYNNLHVMFGVNITEKTLGCYMYRRFGPSIPFYLSYSDEDARKEGSFLTTIYVTNSDGDTTSVLVYNPDELGYYPKASGWKTASPGIIKYYDRTAESASLKQPRADIYVLRYAEVLLNYSEAENALNGVTSDALDGINEVRERAGLDDLPSSLTKEQLADSIYRERGWEFIGETKLYFDELRTNRIGENVKAMFNECKDLGIYMYKGYSLDFVPDKNFLWKIPQYDLDSNSALEQNPDNVSR